MKEVIHMSQGKVRMQSVGQSAPLTPDDLAIVATQRFVHFKGHRVLNRALNLAPGAGRVSYRDLLKIKEANPKDFALLRDISAQRDQYRLVGGVFGVNRELFEAKALAYIDYLNTGKKITPQNYSYFFDTEHSHPKIREMARDLKKMHHFKRGGAPFNFREVKKFLQKYGVEGEDYLFKYYLAWEDSPQSSKKPLLLMDQAAYVLLENRLKERSKTILGHDENLSIDKLGFYQIAGSYASVQFDFFGYANGERELTIHSMTAYEGQKIHLSFPFSYSHPKLLKDAKWKEEFVSWLQIGEDIQSILADRYEKNSDLKATIEAYGETAIDINGLIYLLDDLGEEKKALKILNQAANRDHNYYHLEAQFLEDRGDFLAAIYAYRNVLSLMDQDFHFTGVTRDDINSQLPKLKDKLRRRNLFILEKSIEYIRSFFKRDSSDVPEKFLQT